MGGKGKHIMWTCGEIQQLREFTAQGMPNKIIAEKLGRKLSSVHGQLVRQGIQSPNRPKQTRRRWRPEEDKFIINAVKNGKSRRFIARQLGRTMEAVKRHQLEIQRRQKNNGLLYGEASREDKR